MYKFKIYANVMYKFSKRKILMTKTDEFAYIVIEFLLSKQCHFFGN